MELTPGLCQLVRDTADRFFGSERRAFLADVMTRLGLGQRRTAAAFGWDRATLRLAAHERRTGVTCADATYLRGRKPAEEVFPTLLADLGAIVADHTQADPTLKTDRVYCRLTLAEVRRQLVEHNGYDPATVPGLQTLNVKLHALGCHVRAVRKCVPKKRSPRRTRSSAS